MLNAGAFPFDSALKSIGASASPVGPGQRLYALIKDVSSSSSPDPERISGEFCRSLRRADRDENCRLCKFLETRVKGVGTDKRIPEVG